MLQQPLQAASTSLQLPQLRRPSAYMVCPSRQAALLPKPASPVALPVAFLVCLLRPPPLVIQSPAAESLPPSWASAPTAGPPSVLSTSQNGALPALVCPACPSYKLFPTVLSLSRPCTRMYAVAGCCRLISIGESYPAAPHSNHRPASLFFSSLP